jgi:hypothetical protein
MAKTKFLVSKVPGLTVGLKGAPSVFLSEVGGKVPASAVEPGFLEIVENTSDYDDVLEVVESDEGPSADDTSKQRGDVQGPGNMGALGKNELGTPGTTKASAQAKKS